jgi:hypothetical protein
MNKLTGLMEPTFILEEDLIKCKTIMSWKKVTKREVGEMQRFMRNYIDPKCTICPHCPAQVKFAHNRIINWWNHTGSKLKVKDANGKWIKKQKV